MFNLYLDCQATDLYRSSPVDIFIIRARIFYSRPDFIPKTNCILVGLPINRWFSSFVILDSLIRKMSDVLNRLQPPFDANAGRDHTFVIDSRKQAEQVRHLSKYVFARQYGLATPFHSTSASFKFSRCPDREAEIKVSCLRPLVLSLIEKIWVGSRAL